MFSVLFFSFFTLSRRFFIFHSFIFHFLPIFVAERATKRLLEADSTSSEGPDQSLNPHHMPTVFIFFGFRFMFYSNDHDPIHVHIVKDDCEAKYNVSPIEQVYNHGFKKQQIAIIESIIEENVEVITERWKAHFNEE